jgi:hypothetical protein
MEMKQAEEKGREESDKEPLLMSSDASGKRLCLSCRLMIFFLHNLKLSGSRLESFKLTSFQYV